MNRQYIGARYVPKFYEGTNGNTWESGQSYEALTIVTYLNNSYTSKIPVPANIGNPADNGFYWALTGNFNGQVEEYRQAVEALTNGNFIILGDSYGVDSTVGGTSWATQVITNYPNCYHNIKGGTGFASDVYMSDNWLSMLEELDSEIINKNAINKIVILGGANDANLLDLSSITIDLLKTRIDSFMNYCKNTYPNAIVCLGFIGWRKGTGGTITSLFNSYTSVRNCYKTQINKHRNGKYFNGGEYICHNMSFLNSTDMIHPTGDANTILGEFAFSVINGSDFKFVYSHSVAVEANTGYTVDQYSYSVNYLENICNINLIGNYDNYTYSRVILATEQTITGVTIFDVGTLTNIPYIDSVPTITNVSVVDGYTGGTKLVPASVVIQHGHLFIKIFTLESLNVKMILLPNVILSVLLEKN